MNFIWLAIFKFKDQIFRGFAFIIFGILIILALGQLTDFGKVAALTFQSLGRINLLVLVFLAIYYFLKFQTERFLISKLDLAATGKRIALLFAIAESVREFPTIPLLIAVSATTKQGGKFFPLRMFAALTPQLPLEIAACFLMLAAFGFRNLPYLQLASLLAVLGTFTVLVILGRMEVPKFLISEKGNFWQKFVKILLDLKYGLERVLDWKNLLISFLLIFCYILSLATVLYLISSATGFAKLGLTQAWSVFALIYIAIIFSPLPGDWGISESSGFILLSFLGSSPESALATMLSFRIIFSSATYLLIGAICWFLWSDIQDYLASFFPTTDKGQNLR